MKQFRLVLVLLLFVGLTSANKKLDRKVSKCNMPEVITEIVSFPCEMQLNAQNNFALVEFAVNEKGTISVLQINACQKLKDHVVEALNGYQLICPKGHCGKTFSFKLIFKDS